MNRYRDFVAGDNQLARDNGCRDPRNASYFSSMVGKCAWVSHPCLKHKESKLKSRVKWRFVKHFTLKKCAMSNEVLALCVVHKPGDGWRLDSVHPVGKCPHCIYR